MQTYTHFLWAVVLSRWVIGVKKRKKSNKSNKIPAFDRRGVLLGSVLPDLPLIATTIVCVVHDYFFVADDNDDGEGGSSSSMWTDQLFSSWYFSNPYVMAEHSLFHSPVSLAVLISATYLAHRHLQQKHANKKEYDDDSVSDENNIVDGTAENADGRRATTEVRPVFSYSCWVCCCSSCLCSCRSWYWILSSALFHALCDIPVHHDDGALLLWPLNWSYRFESPLSYYDPDYYGKQFAICEHILDLIIVIGEVYRCRGRCFRSSIATSEIGEEMIPDDEDNSISIDIENRADAMRSMTATQKRLTNMASSSPQISPQLAAT
mmetsp:Transcript_33909/g.78296  ORF Transcript_33909/g.78296 Transcript_33909/m.78296 type:complete len:321 (-) Transcript_33909:700-1662(-)